MPKRFIAWTLATILTRKTTYIFVFVYSLAVFAVAGFVHVWGSYSIGPVLASTTVWGYGARMNWYSMPVLLAVALFVLRWIWRELTGVNGSAPLTQLAMDCAGPQEAQVIQALLAGLLGGLWGIVMVTLAAIALNGFDFWSSSGRFFRCPSVEWSQPWTEGVCHVNQMDWSVMSLLPNAPLSRKMNLAFDALAYLQQLALVEAGLLVVVMLIAHNWLFLRLVYLRYSPSALQRPIYVRPLDPQNAFGLACAGTPSTALPPERAQHVTS
jgi:hypothetical protein